jgi:HTH-type transcriptional regulator/antitoxin HipB
MAIESVRQLAATLRGRRIALGLTQAEVAERAGVSRDWVNTFEAGKSSVELSLVMRLLDALGLRLDVAKPGGGPETSETGDIDLDALLDRYRAQ